MDRIAFYLVGESEYIGSVYFVDFDLLIFVIHEGIDDFFVF